MALPDDFRVIDGPFVIYGHGADHNPDAVQDWGDEDTEIDWRYRFERPDGLPPRLAYPC